MEGGLARQRVWYNVASVTAMAIPMAATVIATTHGTASRRCARVSLFLLRVTPPCTLYICEYCSSVLVPTHARVRRELTDMSASGFNQLISYGSWAFEAVARFFTGVVEWEYFWALELGATYNTATTTTIIIYYYYYYYYYYFR